MVGVIAATRVELRALLGNHWMRLLLAIAMFFPLIAWLMSEIGALATGATRSPTMGYGEAFWVTLSTGGAASLFAAAMIATTSHRHGVFQSYVVTGHPRDLLFVGRLCAAWVATLLIGVTSLASGLVLHVAFPPVTMSGGDSPVALTSLAATVVAADIASVLGLLLVGATAAVGVASLTRNVAGAGGVAFACYAVESVAVDLLRGRWVDDAAVVPLARATEVPATFEAPWWSASHALGVVAWRPEDGGLAAAWLLLAWACVIACAAGLYRMLWRDA